MTLGKKIYELRIEKGYSQEEFASQLNVSRQAVSKWERDEALPDLYNLKNIASIFNISIDVLLNQKNVMEPLAEMSSRNKLAFSFMMIPTFVLLISSMWILGHTIIDFIGGLS